MTAIAATTSGYLYILCFERPIGNAANTRAQASHYLGWALDVRSRVAAHASGHGAAITAAVVRAGIGWQVYYRTGTPELERWLKARYKNTAILCPHCATARNRRPALDFQPAVQLSLPLPGAAELADFPPPLPGARMDFYEIVHLRSWRAERAALAPAPDLSALDEML